MTKGAVRYKVRLGFEPTKLRLKLI